MNNSLTNSISFLPITDSIENNQSGWSSPPRSTMTHQHSIDQSSTTSCTINNSTSTDILLHSQTTNDIDIKPNINSQTNNLMQFVEQFQNELQQIHNEYYSKFNNDQRYIDQEIRLLIHEEQHTFDKLQRYLIDQQKQTKKRKTSHSVRKK